LIVERTDFISVPVTDIERSAAWYRDTLGLPQIADGVCHMAFFADPDGNQLLLHRRHDA
jgi:catechol 2,3-dioxygenase-like lactoylglutathione lyase family enzyme